MIPLSHAKPEIHNLIQTQQMQSSTDALLKNFNSELNADCFGGLTARSRPKAAAQAVKPETK
jgi:hypothetical protein